jgi:signal transduction histidine kinase
MLTENNSKLLQRSLGRRKEDTLVRNLLKFGQIITSEINMDVLFKLIIEETNQIINVEYCTIFVHEEKSNELLSFHASGPKKNEVHVSPATGISGWVFTNKEPILVNDVHSNPWYYPEVDNMLGFNAKSILSVPLINREKECIGVFQALNKKSSDGSYADFILDDLDLFYALSSFVVISLENSKMYEKLKLLDKAKERVINHIAHEMKTPLTVISFILNRISKKIGEGDIVWLEKKINMAQRNIERLSQLQAKIDDILNEKSYDEKLLIMHVIEDAFNFIQVHKDKHIEYEDILGSVSDYIESFYGIPDVKFEMVPLYDFLYAICEEALANKNGRNLQIIADFGKGINLNMDKHVLTKVCTGLLKNAIENTPDEGKIEVRSSRSDGHIYIEFQDYGVGITDENQRMIFSGFYHTQDTFSYSTKEPYAFNAGGAGADLLRIKVFSERCGFAIDFSSTRCKMIPKDTDLCPGKVSLCKNTHNVADCCSLGGSIFTLKFKE